MAPTLRAARCSEATCSSLKALVHSGGEKGYLPSPVVLLGHGVDVCGVWSGGHQGAAACGAAAAAGPTAACGGPTRLGLKEEACREADES